MSVGLDVLGAVAQPIASIIGGAIQANASTRAANKAAAAQLAINQQNIDFQQAENEITRAREDTAHQREVADLQAAGLSPLANLGGAQAQALAAPQADANGFLQAAEMQASGASAGAQMAVSGISQGAQNAATYALKRDELKQTLQIEKAKLDQQQKQFEASQSQAQSQFEFSQAQQESQFQRSESNKRISHVEQLEEVVRNNDMQHEAKTKEQVIKLYKDEKERVSNIYKGIQFEEYDSDEKYKKALAEWYDWAKDHLPKENVSSTTSVSGEGEGNLKGLARLSANFRKTTTSSTSGYDGARLRPYPIRSIKLISEITKDKH